MKTRLVTSEFDLANPPALTNAQRAELARAAATADEAIDTSDIPPLSDAFWADAIRFQDRRLYRPVKKQVTLRLDADLIEWFKAQQGGARGYQTAINAALRKAVEQERGKVE
jgi:uncharacterized protein (DUF4415 family)